ncbi:MAG TPA: class I SAM-dependent methyltransferase [Reyranella sp.]|nr:class I SAM-dependent methyltransferase [Reyranella sp.]
MAKLHAALDEIDKIRPDAWYRNLSPRQRAEMEFHNRDRAPTAQAEARAQDTYEKFYGNKKYYSATRRSVDYGDSWIDEHSPGKVVLDYACGNGKMALRAAKAGAKLAIGIDISDVSIANCQRSAAELGLSNVRFVQANAEATMLPDESIDTVLCFGMLHHLDLSYAFPELRRIMKEGGRLFAAEALDYNLAIKLYRMLTPDMRTEWEKAHILSHKDLRFARRFFDIGEIRYWHPTAYIGGKIRPLLPVLDLADRVLERIPLVQLWSWIWTFELIRPKKL